MALGLLKGPVFETRRAEPSQKEIWARKAEEQLEHLWQTRPQKFANDTARNRLRLDTAFSLIAEHGYRQVADIGCGAGELARRLAAHEARSHITCSDIARTPLQSLAGERIHAQQEHFPFTKLPDSSFDTVLCLDVLAYIEPIWHRLAMSELARLVTADGWVHISSPLDLHARDALPLLLKQVTTEFVVVKSVVRPHKLLVHLEQTSRLAEQQKNLFQKVAHKLLWPLRAQVHGCNITRRVLDKISEFVWSQDAISHVHLICQKKRLRL